MQKIDYEKYKKPSNIYKPSEGKNVIRIISNGVLLKEHSTKIASRFVPLGECLGGDCPHCARGMETSQVWSWIVWDRDNDVVKLAKFGAMIGDGICQMAKELHTDPQDFDIEITRIGFGKKTEYKVLKLEGGIIPPDKLEKMKKAKEILINKYFRQ